MAGDREKSKELVDELVNILTEQDIETVAQRVANDKSISILKRHFSSFSQEVLGMLGSYWLLTITIRRKNHESPEKVDLFVKAVPYENPKQANFITSQGIFSKESLLFEKAIPFLVENYKSDKWAATCYLAKKDVLVLENLRSQGYRLLALYDNLSAIKSALATVARFHGCSILAESRLQQMNESATTLDKYWPDLFNETMFTRTGGSSVWVRASIEAASLAAEKYGHDPRKIRTACNKVYELILPSEKHCNVICHGDLWANNIMIDGNSEPYRCVLVDFQLLRYAPLMLDVLQLLHINSSRNFRREFEKTLVEHYHSILMETIRNHEPTGQTRILTLTEISSGLEDFRLFGAILACFYRLLGPKVATECMTSHEKYARFLSGDVFDIITSFMEQDATYKTQVEDAINELAEISVQI